MTRTLNRGTGALIATVTALLLSFATVAPALATDEPSASEVAETAASWLAGQLVDGERIESTFGDDTFPDQGLTADVVFALAAAGVGADHITDAVDWLITQTGAYTGAAFDSVFAGATAKLILALETDGRDPRTASDTDLVQQLLDREQDADAGRDQGRFTDDSDFGDFSSTLTQSLAVLGLHRADGVSPSEAAVGFLLAQQCDDGGFRFDPDEGLEDDGPEPSATEEETEGTTEADDDVTDAGNEGLETQEDEGEGSPEGDSGETTATENVEAAEVDQPCTSAVDTTAFAVQALAAVGGQGDAVADAVAWLASVQETNGGFEGGDGVNTNSAGLAAVALDLGGASAAADAARAFIVDLQDGCDGERTGAILFNEADEGDRARATSQAVPGLASVSLAEVTASGATADLTPLSCPPPVSDSAVIACDLDALEVTAGDEVDCTVTELLDGEQVDVEVVVNPTLLDERFDASEDGSVAFGFTVPDDREAGDVITITVRGADGSVLTELELTVVATLPETGLNLRLGGLGLVLALLGSALVLTTRRRSFSAA